MTNVAFRNAVKVYVNLLDHSPHAGWIWHGGSIAASVTFGAGCGRRAAHQSASFGDGDDSPCGLVIFLFIIGIALMIWAYRTFRHGEQFEYRSGGASTLYSAISDPVGTIKTGFSSVVPGSLKVEDIEKWIQRLN